MDPNSRRVRLKLKSNFWCTASQEEASFKRPIAISEFMVGLTRQTSLKTKSPTSIVTALQQKRLRQRRRGPSFLVRQSARSFMDGFELGLSPEMDGFY